MKNKIQDINTGNYYSRFFRLVTLRINSRFFARYSLIIRLLADCKQLGIIYENWQVWRLFGPIVGSLKMQKINPA